MRIFFSFILLLLTGCLAAQEQLSALLPMPNQIALDNRAKPFLVHLGKTSIYPNDLGLDFAGHTVAILAAYSELGCTHTDTLPKVVGKTVDRRSDGRGWNIVTGSRSRNVFIPTS